MREGHKFNTNELITDGSGAVVASGETTSGWLTYGATKDGYYRTLGKQLLLERKGNRYEPWNSVKELVLKPILNPIPMYARKIEMLRLPEVSNPIGFDLVKSNWVTPYGKGTASDLIFTLQKTFVDVEKPFETSLTITFTMKETASNQRLQRRLTGASSGCLATLQSRNANPS